MGAQQAGCKHMLCLGAHMPLTKSLASRAASPTPKLALNSAPVTTSVMPPAKPRAASARANNGMRVAGHRDPTWGMPLANQDMSLGYAGGPGLLALSRHAGQASTAAGFLTSVKAWARGLHAARTSANGWPQLRQDCRADGLGWCCLHTNWVLCFLALHMAGWSCSRHTARHSGSLIRALARCALGLGTCECIMRHMRDAPLVPAARPWRYQAQSPHCQQLWPGLRRHWMWWPRCLETGQGTAQRP